MNGLTSLGIDLTSLVLYLVNFGLLYLIVSRFISKPLLNIIKERSETIQNNLSNAEKLRDEIAKEKEEIERYKNQVKAEMDKEMKLFKESLMQQASEREAEFLKRREALFNEANMEISSQKKKILQELQEDILDAMYKVTSEVLKDKVSEGVIRKSVTEVWEKYLNEQK